MSDIKSIADLKPDPRNANTGTQRGRYMIDYSLRELGAGRSILCDADGNVIAGNKTLEVAAELGLDVEVVRTHGDRLVVVVREDLQLDGDDGRARQLAYADNRTSEVGLDWDVGQLIEDIDAGLDLDGLWRGDELEELVGAALNGEQPDTPEAQTNRADELREEWGTDTGQLWRIPSAHGGEHRIICGDCTDADVVARVMGDDAAILCHADPPYGMGKEKDGIANDNLYRDKLDAFQMQWWGVARLHLADNASAYIWGNAEDLWRLWYIGGLRESERLTFRNEIVWDKEHSQGQGSETLRSYPPTSERCLFFMLGQQEFSENADNYWEGWDNIRIYLKSQRDLMGWDNAYCKQLAGHSETSGCHWFDESQWTFPTADVYNVWRKAAAGDAFRREYDDLRREYDDLRREYDDLRREYDDLRREFYSTRAPFDNAHDIMSDVWRLGKVQGDDRMGHATPKPVEIMERIIKSSSATGDVVYAPFLGTAPEIVACERLARLGRGVEISPAYVAVCLQRLADMGLEPELA